MNNIQQAAEAMYPEDRFCDPPDYVSVRHYEEHVTHFLQFLSQQGDEDIVTYLVLTNRSLEITIKQALAIGRAMNRWIPVTERLPEEKDAVEIDGALVIETLTWDKLIKWWRLEILVWDERWIKDEEMDYWRTPSQYPEPPKSEV